MRNGLPRATGVAASDRDTRPSTAQAMLARVASCLLGLLLVLQLAGVPHHGLRVAPADAKAIALAGLGAAIGQPVTLCDHGGDPSRPDDPAHTGSCEHCIFCHSMSVGAPATPVVAIGIVRVATAADIERPRADVALLRARPRGGATPRGPPTFG